MSELSPEAKQLLEVAREEFSPDAQRVASVRNALEQRLLAPGGGGGGGPLGSVGASAGQWVGLGVVAVGLVASVGVFVARNFPAESESARTSPAFERAPALSGSAPRDDQSRHAAIDRSLELHATRAANRDSPRGAPIGVPRSVVAGEPQAIARTLSSPARHAHESLHALSPTARASSHAEPERASASDSAASAKAPVADAAPARAAENPPADDSLAREIALLRDARAALDRHDPRTALAIADAHAASFANGTMRQEQLATRVLALCALHRQAEAIAAARELEHIAPRSPHLLQIRASCAAPKTPSEAQ